LGTTGTTVDVTLGYKDADFVRSHFDVMAVSIDGAPRPDEIVVALVANSGRL